MLRTFEDNENPQQTLLNQRSLGIFNVQSVKDEFILYKENMNKL